jgi:hypothetical protein
VKRGLAGTGGRTCWKTRQKRRCSGWLGRGAGRFGCRSGFT